MDERLLVQQMITLYEHCEDYVFFMKRIAPFSYEYVYINKAAEPLFDEAPIQKELGKTNISQGVVESIRANYEEAYKQNKQVIYRDFYLFGKHNHTNEMTIWPVHHAEDTYLLVMSKSISKRKEIEEEQHFLSALFANQENAMLVVAENRQILKANQQFYTLPEIGKDNVEGQYINVAFSHCKKLYAQIIEKLSKIFDGSQKETLKLTSDFSEEKYSLIFSPIYLEEKIIAASLEWLPHKNPRYLEETLKKTSYELDGYRQALASATNFCITDTEGVIEFVSDGYEKITGYSNEELIGSTNRILNSRQHPKEFYKELWDTVKSGNLWSGEICNRTKMGTYYWAHTSIVPILNAHNEIENFLSLCIDVTDRHGLVANLRSVEKTFKLITENTNDFITIVNEDGIILYVSPNHEKRLGYREEQLVGRFYTDLLTDQSDAVFQHEFVKVRNRTEDVSLELELQTVTGETLWTDAYITGVQDSDRESIYQFVMIAREITDRKQKEEELRFLAYHDALTLLPNRRFLTLQYSSLERDALQNNNSIVVMYIDGDNFKAINDQFGHDVGDVFIREFGKALKRSVRDSDIVCRIGGDEFVIVLTKMSIDVTVRRNQALSTIQRIQTILRQGWTIDGHHFSPTSSIGISMLPDNGQHVDVLLEKADEALYYAKNEKGKDSYCFSTK